MLCEISGCLLLGMMTELLRDGLLDYDNVQNAVKETGFLLIEKRKNRKERYTD